MNERIIKAYGELLALQAELEGMKAMNKERELRGEALPYLEDSFLALAHQMRLVAQTIRNRE